MDKKLKKRLEKVLEELTGEHIEVQIDVKSMKINNSKQVIDKLKRVKVKRTRKMDNIDSKNGQDN